MITQRTRLDMRPGGVLPVVHVSQYDNDAAALIFDLYNGGELFSVPTGSSVLLNGLKPDNYGFSYQAASISGNTVVCNLTTQMTAVAGAVVCELRVRNGAGTQIIGSCNFILQVEAAALTDDTIISETMIPLIEQAVEIASNLDRYITQTQSNAQIATEAATTATNAANSAQIVDANVTGLYNSIEEAKTNANTAAANANAVAAQVAQQAASGAFKGDKGDKGDSGVTTPVWGMYTMYVDSAGDLWLVTNGEYGSEYWFKYDSETGLLYYCTPDYVEKTVSGELIEITDAANLGALQCKVAFSPIQSGTGDPSPTNIRPISGRTGLTVTRAGKNLFDNSTLSRVDRNTFRSGFVYLPSGTYTFSRPSADNLYNWYVRSVPTEAYTDFTNLIFGGTNKSSGSFTLANGSWIYIEYYNSGGIADGAIKNIQIEVGSTSTDYTPYVGQTYPITWETEAGIVYGGTLDVVSGVLTVTHGLVAFDGSENWVLSVPSTAGCYVQLNDLVKTNNYIGKILCDKLSIFSTYQNDAYNSAEYGITAYGGAYHPNQNWIYAKNERTPTVASFKAWLSENPITICYELATPQTYQLTPTEVRTILGVNNLWGDGDTIEAFTYVSESYDEEG